MGRTESIKTQIVLETKHISGGLIVIWPKQTIDVGKLMGSRTGNVGWGYLSTS